MRARLVPPIVAALVLAAATAGGAPATARVSPQESAAEKLAAAEERFAAGDYPAARALVDAALEEIRTQVRLATPSVHGTLSRLHALSALLAYAFRDEGFEDLVDRELSLALEEDPYLDLGDPAEVPTFVQTRFRRLQTAYLARFSRTERRTSLGLTAALVLEPAVLTENPSVLQPGFAYALNLGDNVSLNAGLRFPLVWPPWDSVRGQVGLTYYPIFRVERVITGITFAYLFGLDELSTFTHSLAIGGRAEYVTRGGFGVGMNAELLRANIVIGAGGIQEPPPSTDLNLGDLLNIVFANLSLNLFWTY
jgi:hypothetical protein